MTQMTIRPARPEEVPALEALIAASARGLRAGFYTAEQAEAAIAHVFGVDSELVGDGTYLVVEATDGSGDIWGCGGWSQRATLFGGDRFAGRASGLLDPATDAAKIRAFFVAPQAARRGDLRQCGPGERNGAGRLLHGCCLCHVERSSSIVVCAVATRA
jgi:hypothetical protein